MKEQADDSDQPSLLKILEKEVLSLLGSIIEIVGSTVCCILIILVIVRNKKLRTFVNWLVIYESIINLVNGTIIPLLIIIRIFTKKKYAQNICSTMSSLLAFSLLQTQYIFFMICFVRWLHICKNIQMKSVKNVLIIIMPGTTAALIVAYERFTSTTSIFCEQEQLKQKKKIKGDYFALFIVIYSTALFLMMSAMSLHITAKVWHHRQTVHPAVSNRNNRKQQKIEVVTTLSQMLHITLFLVTYFPLPLCSHFIPREKLNHWIAIGVFIFTIMGTLIDPLLYLIFSSEFRNTVKSLFIKEDENNLNGSTASINVYSINERIKNVASSSNNPTLYTNVSQQSTTV